MVSEEARNQIRTRIAHWRASLAQLRAEREGLTGEGWRASVERLQELRANIAEEVREWNARIDDYDADPTQTTQKAFENQVGLRELERQIDADLEAWKREAHGVG